MVLRSIKWLGMYIPPTQSDNDLLASIVPSDESLSVRCRVAELYSGVQKSKFSQ